VDLLTKAGLERCGSSVWITVITVLFPEFLLIQWYCSQTK